MKRTLRLLASGMTAALLGVGGFVFDAPSVGAESLLGYDMSVDARGAGVFWLIPDSAFQPELNIPQASAMQQSGTGYGLASAAWPGAIVANGGTLLGILIPGFPPEVAALLVYPVRAEARSGQDPPTTSYNAPGITMRSRADDTSAEAEAGAQGISVLPGSFGAMRTTASTRATANEAIATARSEVKNLDLAGVLKIEKIVSTAKATSDGDKGTGTAKTVITGATVMGQGVTIDETGLHFGDTNTPIDAVVQQVAKQALDSAGIKVTLGPVTKELNGAAAVVGAQSLVVTLSQGGQTWGFALGGARASSVASGGDAVDDLLDAGIDVLGGSLGDSAVDDGLGFGDLGGGPGAPEFDVIDNTGAGAGAGAGGGAPLGLTPTSAGAVTGRGLSGASMVLGVLAALLLAAGLRRLNTAVLAEPAVVCTLPGADE